MFELPMANVSGVYKYVQNKQLKSKTPQSNYFFLKTIIFWHLTGAVQLNYVCQ